VKQCALPGEEEILVLLSDSRFGGFLGNSSSSLWLWGQTGGCEPQSSSISSSEAHW
jgi:hypothetical protein